MDSAVSENMHTGSPVCFDMHDSLSHLCGPKGMDGIGNSGMPGFGENWEEKVPFPQMAEREFPLSPKPRNLESDLICFVEIWGTEGLNSFYSWKTLLPFWLAKKSFMSKASCFPKIPPFPLLLEMFGILLWGRTIVSLTLGESDKLSLRGGGRGRKERFTKLKDT